MSRSRFTLALLLAGASALTFAQARAAVTTPPAQSAPPVPAPSATPGVSFDLPAMPATNVSGVWEVAHEADSGQTTYTHLRFQQKGSVLTGDWLDTNGKAYPASGKIDGNALTVDIQGPQGKITVQARVDPPANMVGIFVEPGGKHVIFTANNQAKYTPAPDTEGSGDQDSGGSVPH